MRGIKVCIFHMHSTVLRVVQHALQSFKHIAHILSHTSNCIFLNAPRLTTEFMSRPCLPHRSVTSLSSEWHNVRLAATSPDSLAALRQLQQDRDCSVVVLSLYADAAAAGDAERATPPLGANARQQQQQQRGVLVARVTGLVRWWELDQGAVYVHVRPCCGRHPAEHSSPCCKVRASGASIAIVFL
jgi:hypothetical protein